MKTRRKVAARMNQKVSKPELITILSGTFLCMLNQFLISPALPAIMNQYGITTGVVQWLTNGFTMVCALLVPMSAFLIRKYAIRNLFLFSMILFMGGSVLIGSGGMFLFVLAGRILQAIGAGIMVPISQVYLLNAFPKEKRGNAMGMMALVIAAAPAFGPVIAGVTIDHFGWYWMFRAMALAAATVLVTAWIVLKTGRGESSLRIDWYSVICSCLGFGGILYGLSAASDAGIAAPEVLVSLAGGSLFLVLFVRRQNSSEDPFLKLNVLNVDSFRTGVILIFIANACLAGGTVLIPVFVQNICGCSATTSGMIMAPGAILMGILGSIAGRVYDKKGPRGLSITGFVLLTLGNFSFCFAGSAWPAVLTGVLYTLRMAGVALINTPVMTWAMNDLSKEELPHGVSVFHTFRQMSGSIGTVIMVLVMGLVESAGGHTPVSAIRGLSAAFALISVIGMAGLILAIRKERYYTMKEILFFNEIDRSMNAAVGGKGANLGEMTRAGMAVPTGFCLTTRVYDEFAAGLSLEGLPADEARAILQKQDLPDGCAELMKEALRGFPEGTLFSVRSSATAEDLPYASFAGQQDTYLNVTAEGLAEAVKNCFISLFTDRAVSYRRQNGITKPSMSVVVQQMVRSDASGIMFTADPVSGNRNHLVIDAVFGLGEAIVSGLVSPDHITFNKPAKQIVSCETACKEFALLPLPGGGTEKKMLHSSEPVLTEEQIQGLAALGELLEKHYEAPQDVEWAVENGKLYILQTRAITSLYPVPGPFEDGKFHFLFNLGYQQMNPEAMPVMALDGVLGATNILEEDLPDYKSIMIYGFGQHIFVDMSRIFSIKPLGKLVLRILPVADSLAASAVQEMLGRGLKFARPDRRLSKLPRRLFKALPRFARAKDPAGAAAFAVRQLRESSDAAAETLRSTPVNAEAVRTLFREIQIINGFSDPFMPMVVSSILALNKLKKTEEKLGCKGRWTETLQIGNAGNAITEMGLSLGDLADYAAADEGFRRLLEENERNLHEALMERNDEKGDAYRRFMEQYGFRGPGEIDISRPRYEENPTPIIHQILAMSDHKEPGSHRREYEEKNEKAVKAGEELIEEIRSKLGERAARKARRQLAKYQAYYPFREHFKYFWMKRYIEARRLLLRIGETMTEKGQISCREDIMHLHMKEVYEALQSDADLHELVDGRRQEFERVSRLTPPRIITCEGEVLMGSVSREDIPEGALAGVGVSPGTVEGIARVVLDPNEASIAEGEILVAPFTDPGWTPLFVNAEAVVTEIGGMLTHGAVVAREYGIPGVVGVVDATKKITTGQKIRVDGTTGYVEII